MDNALIPIACVAGVLLLMVMRAYQQVAQLTQPPPIFRRSSRWTLTSIGYVTLFLAAMIFPNLPVLLYAAIFVAIIGSIWTWLAPPDPRDDTANSAQ